LPRSAGEGRRNPESFLNLPQEVFKMVQHRKSTTIRKQQIMEAARKLIIKKGSEHLTVRAIASVVNITEAAIYRHFKSKREILSFLMTHITDDMLQEFESQSGTNSHSLDTVNAILKQHLSGIEQRRGMSFQVIAEIISLGDKKLSREVYEKLNLYIDRLRGLLSEGARQGCIRDDIDHGAAALLLFGMIQGLVNIWALGNYSFDLPDKFDALWDIYQKAITTRNPSEPASP
jgi:AcrR family transcriptional regulator